jgi:hypothetical protein
MQCLRCVEHADNLVVVTHSSEWAESPDQLETTTATLVSAVPLQPREASVAFVGTPL